MSVYHRTIEFDGEFAGHAISLDRRFVFYSALPILKSLDGERFESLAEMRAAVAKAFAAQDVTSAAA